MNVLSRVEGMRSPLLFSKALYEARFADLYPENGLYLQRHRKRMQSGFDCYREDNDLKQRVWSRYDYSQTSSVLVQITLTLHIFALVWIVI